jgi:hypothetical protein
MDTFDPNLVEPKIEIPLPTRTILRMLTALPTMQFCKTENSLPRSSLPKIEQPLPSRAPLRTDNVLPKVA